ncbi:glutamine--fructose-6-phosphate transaminase (isomerizing) [Patescibacteria group bacterium]|nr:glutamine--fructose-6-phosphate transaminase (isomerizing) [Patescibacteria group bacterium]MBU1890421.1 glutamine--fructose-6-phosphate transaminase (isomerizing) [Patescibacteria group bacterium]
MCGIAGYIGPRTGKDLRDLLIDELLGRVEYRGYDSAGVAFVDGANLSVVRAAGKVKELGGAIGDREIGTPFIAHTRWATHGPANEANAHPQTSCRGHVAVVHNGVIDNWKALRKALERRNHVFRSETDTEVLAHLIGEYLNGDPLEAVRSALSEVEGTFGIAVLFQDYPDLIVVARRGSSISIGLGDGELFVASDPRSFRSFTDRHVVLEDDQIAVVKLGQEELLIQDIDQVPVSVKVEQIELTVDEIEKGNHDTYMGKEICQQPDSLAQTLGGRITADGRVKLGGLEDHLDALRLAQYIILTAAGTSFYASMVGEILFQEVSGLPARAMNASELAGQKHPVFPEQTLAWALSQSGVTTDTLCAMKILAEMQIPTFGICNAVGQDIARTTQAGVYCRAGVETGVASTKAFTSQVAVLQLVSLYLRQLRGLPWDEGCQRHLSGLQAVPEIVRRIIDQREVIQHIAEPYRFATDFYFLGRGILYPVAMEGALKLKEVSYVHAEGYSMAGMKHGPIALIEPRFPTIVLVPKNDENYAHNLTNVQEIRARGGPVIAIATEGDEEIADLVDDVIFVPKVMYYLMPLVYVIPLQLFAYYIAKKLGRNVDQPRHLAKAVTVG